MEDVRYGVSDPPSGWIVKLGDPVTVRCSEGFQFGGKSISVTKLESCNAMPACSRGCNSFTRSFITFLINQENHARYVLCM